METDSAKTFSQAQSSSNQQKLFSDDGEAYSYKSSKSNQNVSSDIDLEHNEEYKQAEMLAISSFVDKKNLELSQVNDKYSLQVKQLEARGINRKFTYLYYYFLTLFNFTLHWDFDILVFNHSIIYPSESRY